MSEYKSPYPYFGGKSKVAAAVWQRFGKVANFVEPFFGSGAMLLGRPGWTPTNGGNETVNDADGFICNFWRAVQEAPAEVAKFADSRVDECDLHARHVWLVGQRESITARLEGDPFWFDARIAGWWVWGICCWIGSGWCSGNGPWQTVEDEDGNRQLVHLGSSGQGVNRQRVHLGDSGQGVNRQRVHLGDSGKAGLGEEGLYAWMDALQERLRRVRVCCGDWERVCGPSVTFKNGLTAVYLDPPYSGESDREESLYSVENLTVAHDVRRWCAENGDNKELRIALSGYAGEHESLERAGWDRLEWSTSGGYGSQGDGRGFANKGREVIWFSPHCVRQNVYKNLNLFEMALA